MNSPLPQLIPSHSPQARRSHALTETKREVLAFVADNFCVTADMLADHLGIEERMAQRHFQELENATGAYRYITSVPHYQRGKRRGSPRMAYGLSRRGVLRCRQLGVDTDSTKTVDDLSPDSMPHLVGITNYHIRLTAYCRERAWQLTWRQGHLNKLRKIKIGDKWVMRGVHPDALFRIEAPTGKTFIPFYEYEKQKLGKEDEQGNYDITRKCYRYDAYYDTPMCAEDFGFRRIPVIIEVPTEERAKNLATHLRAKGLIRSLFLICATNNPLSFITPESDHSLTLDSLLGELTEPARTAFCTILSLSSTKAESR